MDGTRLDDTLASALWPRGAAGADASASPRRGRLARLFRDVALCVAGIAVLTVAGKIKVPLTPVPMTLELLAVLCLGAAYGARLSIVMVAGYLLCGLCGLPVFANTPPLVAGPAYFLGPTGGFLIGFLPAGALMGLAAEARLDRAFGASLACALVADTVLFACGFVWLAFAARTTVSTHGLGVGLAWARGVVPFLLGDALKIALAAALLPAMWTLVGRFGPKAS